MRRYLKILLVHAALCLPGGVMAAGPDCTRVLTLGLHEHGLLYSAETGAGIDKDVVDEMIRRSGCKISVTLMARARIWQLIESGALDFSLSGITNDEREQFAAFAWYFSNKYYLLVRNDAKVRRLSDFAANPNLKLGVIRSFRYSKNANALVDQLHEARRVTHASALDPLYEILLLNRIQGMIIEPFDYSQVASSAVADVTTIIDAGDPAVRHGLIMSKRSLSVAQRQKWQDLISEMRADGTMLRIFEKYFKADLAAAMVSF